MLRWPSLASTSMFSSSAIGLPWFYPGCALEQQLHAPMGDGCAGPLLPAADVDQRRTPALTDDFGEAVEAFFARRKPIFKGV